MNKKENKISKEIKINKKSVRRNYSNQTGITLIALVVTIVVLLILAGVTINAVFSDSGIIKKAQDAQNKANESVQKDMEQINALENWLNENTGENNKNVPVAPTTDTAPYYPDETFTKVGGTDLSNGLVIQDSNGNEYVWIEVPKSLYANNDYNTETTTADQKPANSEEYDKIEYCLHKYTNYYRNGTTYTDTYNSDATTGLTSEQYTELKQKMLKSVYENGGFWIGRYEAGIETNRTSSSTAITAAPLSKQGTVENPMYTYNYVTCSQAQTLASELSTGKNYTSSLMFGVQWDLVLKHIEVKEVAKGKNLDTIQSELRSDSKDWGNYMDASFTIDRGKYADYKSYTLSTTWTPYNQTTSNNFVNSNNVKQVQGYGDGILLTTGASDVCKKMNIYDLAGNVTEWTLEYASNVDYPCAGRGGYYSNLGSNRPASSRERTATTKSSFTSISGDAGFRLSLFK